MKKLLSLFLVLAVSIVVALLGLGLSSYRMVKPENGWEVFQGISPNDGWIEDGATIALPGLAVRGNRVELKFLGWRPPGIGAARLQAFVCGQLASEFVVDGASSQVVYLTGDCEPRLIEIRVLNPFQASAQDERQLGTQLESLRVYSALGNLPLIKPALGIVAGVFISLLILLSGAVFSPIRLFVQALTLGLCFCLLAGARYLALDICLALWLCTSAVLLGMLCYQKIRTNRRGAPSEPEFSRPTFVLGLAFLLGTALRFYGLDFGLPLNFHPDEVPKVNAIMRMYTQDTLNPQYFLHPSLLLYSTYFVNSLIHLLGTSVSFQESAVYAGRLVSFVAGSLSILLTYGIAARMFSRFSAALAALMLAVYPLHITSSRYLKEDALLTFFILLCTWLTLVAAQQQKKWLLILAGMVAGLAASTKYSGVLTIFILLAAPWIRSRSFIPDRSWIPVTLLAGCFLPLGFLSGTPYSVLDSEKFLRDFNHERSHMSRGHTLAISAWSQYWMYHFQRSLIPGMSFLGTVVAMLGVGLLVVRRRLEDFYLIALILLFYLPAEFVKAKPAPQPERYIFPCLPFLAIAASEFLNFLMRNLKGSRVSLAYLLAGLCLLYPLKRSLQLATEIHTDTRVQMAEWMKQNIPHGSKVAVDWRPYEPAFPDGEFQLEFLPRANIASQLKLERLEDSEYDYLLLSSLWYDRYFSQPRSDVTVRRRIEEVFEKLPVVKQLEPRFGTYGFHNPKLTLFSLKAVKTSRTEGSATEQNS